MHTIIMGSPHINITRRYTYMNDTCRLCSVCEGGKAVVAELLNDGGIRRRMQDIGLIKGTPVCCFLHSGDTAAFLIRGAVIALRREDSEKIIVRPIA